MQRFCLKVFLHFNFCFKWQWSCFCWSLIRPTFWLIPIAIAIVDYVRQDIARIFSDIETRENTISDAEFSALYHLLWIHTYSTRCGWTAAEGNKNNQSPITTVSCVYIRLTVGAVDRRCSTSFRLSSHSTATAATQLFGSGYISSPNYPARYYNHRQECDVSALVCLFFSVGWLVCLSARSRWKLRMNFHEFFGGGLSLKQETVG